MFAAGERRFAPGANVKFNAIAADNGRKNGESRVSCTAIRSPATTAMCASWPAKVYGGRLSTDARKGKPAGSAQ
jgi:hypothetical protein